LNKTSAAFWTEATRLQSLQLSLIRQVMNTAPQNALNLALGELSYPMPEILKEQAVRLLREGNPAYTPNAGLPELRELVGVHHHATGEQVIICNGAEEGVFIALMTILNPGDAIAIPDPDYPAYPAIATILESRIVRLPFEPDLQAIDWDSWEQLLSNGIKAVVLSAPSNPSGFCFTADTARRFAELCNHKGILVIVDEIYAQLRFESPPVSLDKYTDNLIRIGGLSKSHLLSGWRLGWIVAPPNMIPAMTKTRQYISTCSHWLSQKLAMFALSKEGMRVAENVRQQLLSNRNLVRSYLQNSLPSGVLAYHLPQASPYLMLKVQDGMAFSSQAAQKGVITVPGKAFGEVCTDWVRLNYGVEKATLQSAWERLA